MTPLILYVSPFLPLSFYLLGPISLAPSVCSRLHLRIPLRLAHRPLFYATLLTHDYPNQSIHTYPSNAVENHLI